jgi:hypothetical protein
MTALTDPPPDRPEHAVSRLPGSDLPADRRAGLHSSPRVVASGPLAVDVITAPAQAAGAPIVHHLSDTSYGEYGDSHPFTCLDPESHRPGAGTSQPTARAAAPAVRQ